MRAIPRTSFTSSVRCVAQPSITSSTGRARGACIAKLRTHAANKSPSTQPVRVHDTVTPDGRADTSSLRVTPLKTYNRLV